MSRSGLIAATMLALATSGCAVNRVALPDRFAAGRDGEGGRCIANRTWSGAGLTSPQDVGYVLTCSGVTASRAQAVVSAVPVRLRSPEDPNACGASSSATLDGVGAVTVARCNDTILGAPAVVIRYESGGQSYRGAAIASALAPLERALATLVSGKELASEDVTGTAQTKFDSLAPPPNAVATGAGTVDPVLVLREGISLNRQGQYVEASRLLNDVLSQLDPGTSLATRTELLLEAGLADSNIRFTDAAKEHFDQAAALLAANPQLQDAGYLDRKRGVYAALDALNRRDYAGTLAVSTKGAQEAATDPLRPLESASVLAEVNRARSSRRDAGQTRLSSSIGTLSADRIQQLSLDAQLGWARSIATLAENKGPDRAAEELASSKQALKEVLAANIDPAPLAYLIALVERQSGRIAARRAETLTGLDRKVQYDLAIGQFDCALSALLGRAAPNSAACAVRIGDAARARFAGAGGGVTPVVAETQTERAAVRVAAGAGLAEAGPEFAEGVETLIASGRAGSLPPTGLETYLDLLAVSNAKSADPADVEAFFRAVQAVGEPAIARQLSRLQAVVGADQGSAALLRERADLNRQIPALRYQIEALGDSAANTAQKAALSKLRDEKIDRSRTLDEQLLASGKLNTVDDSPVKVADLQRILLADEVYFKIVEVRGFSFGMIVTPTTARIYRINANLAAFSDLVRKVRSSIDGVADPLPVFDVARATVLFDTIAGPPATRALLTKAKRIVFDSGGPMSDLPIGVLVADRDSTIAYLRATKTKPTREVLNNYSKIGFLARQAEIAAALSPRSFIDARGLKQSAAGNPFVGIGEHSAPAISMAAGTTVSFGPNCTLQRDQLVQISLANPPISKAKLANAAGAFGYPNALEITGADFTDQALAARTDLGEYQVVHFATHGLPERQFGCATIPPALLTTVGGAGSDGFLSFSEVAGLKLDANLVVLSACDTSVSGSQQSGRLSGQEETGRALDGLVRAFLAANARAVVATYWQVSADAESDELFRVFYENGRSKTIGASLQAAQVDLIGQPAYSHPYYWGAYFLVGDESKTMLTGGVKLASR